MTNKQEYVCGLLANYTKELLSTEEIAERGRIQIKHSQIIIEQVKKLNLACVDSQRELLSEPTEDFKNGYKVGWKEGYQEGNSDVA